MTATIMEPAALAVAPQPQNISDLASASDAMNASSVEQANHTRVMVARRYLMQPTITDYYTHLTPFITLAIFISVLLFIMNMSIFSTTRVILRKRLLQPALRSSTMLVSLYPVISAMCVIMVLVPVATFACHTVMHLSFTLGAIVFYRMCIRYVDNEANFVKETGGAAIEMNTAPLCCCCRCLPGLPPSPGKFVLLRYMIYQMPFVQGSIMLVLNVFYYREPQLFDTVTLYFLPFLICSILTGIWGLNITVRMISTIRAEYGLMKKLFCLQLIMLLCKFQYMVLDSQLDSLGLDGPYPIDKTIYKQTIISLLILAEMVLVSILAQNAYKVPILTLEDCTYHI